MGMYLPDDRNNCLQPFVYAEFAVFMNNLKKHLTARDKDIK